MSITTIGKSLAAYFPHSWQRAVRRLQYQRQINSDRFVSNEPEFAVVHQYVKPGDWVIDVGANIGVYTKRFSDLVGPAGRVLAFEPIPETFALLVSNMELLRVQNVTLLNAAASNDTRLVGMDVPRFDTGLPNYYCAAVAAEAKDFRVMTLSIDGLSLPRVKMLKIDAEGHDQEVLLGAMNLIVRDLPVLIIESIPQDIEAKLMQLNYRSVTYPHSPNKVLMAS